jgi:hypothetical protein
MLALSDSQLRTIWNAADGLPAEERGVYLERMIAWLQFRGGRFIDRDLDDAVRLALRGLIHDSPRRRCSSRISSGDACTITVSPDRTD